MQELQGLKTDKKKKSTAIAVGAGCIHKDGRYLLAKRPSSKGGQWEFPGGKRESGESIRDCLKRELKEELSIEVAVRPHFSVHEFVSGAKQYQLYFCRCQILRGKPRLSEHEEIRWVAPEEMLELDLASSNQVVIERLLKFRK